MGSNGRFDFSVVAESSGTSIRPVLSIGNMLQRHAACCRLYPFFQLCMVRSYPHASMQVQHLLYAKLTQKTSTERLHALCLCLRPVTVL